MPKIDISYKDLCRLVGKKIPEDKLEDALMYAKCEVENIAGDKIVVECKDTNRPELWSAEGIAREIKGRYGEHGCPSYEVAKGTIVLNVDKKVERVRPLITAAVVKNLKFDENVLSQIIQLQEKIAGTYGRNRKEASIGIYDLKKAKHPITYTSVKPDGIKFVPLEFEKKITPKEILLQHPKGKEFGHLLKGYREYPLLIDSVGEVLSMPPIINSNYTGKITEETKEVFIECTGYDYKFLMHTLNALVCALADRGGRIESVKIVHAGKELVTPDLTLKKSFVDLKLLKKISGLDLAVNKFAELLRMARYDTIVKDGKIEVLYPAYRNDILHQVDITEDALISYNYGKVEPEIPQIKTEGEAQNIEGLSNEVATTMVDIGFQEIVSYTLTNKSNLFTKMNIKEERIVELANPVSSNWNVFRNWLLPSAIEFLANNQHVSYPQFVFEIGDVIVLDETKETKTQDIRKLTAVMADSKVTYREISAVLDKLLSRFKIKYSLKATSHKSFIDGRVAAVIINGKNVGIVGEIHPQVLSNWQIEMPTAGFEIDLESL